MSFGTRVITAASSLSRTHLCGLRFLSASHAPQAMRKPRWTGPPIPKVPGSPYVLFVKERFADFEVTSDAIVSQREMIGEKGKLAGTMWNELTAEEKKQYQDKFAVAKKNYHSALLKFKDNLSSNDFKKLMKFKQKLKAFRQEQRDKQNGLYVEKPKMPSGYHLFMREFFKTDESNGQPQDALRRCAGVWNELSEEEKKNFQEKSKEIKSKAMEEYLAAKDELQTDP